MFTVDRIPNPHPTYRGRDIIPLDFLKVAYFAVQVGNAIHVPRDCYDYLRGEDQASVDRVMQKFRIEELDTERLRERFKLDQARWHRTASVDGTLYASEIARIEKETYFALRTNGIKL